MEDPRKLYETIMDILKDTKSRLAANKLFLLALKGESLAKRKLSKRKK